MKKRPTILIYRRTHVGDPDSRGIFGINHCMKSIRGWDYDAIIGIGGKSPNRDSRGIAKRINWIGICPERNNFTLLGKKLSGPMVTFKRFILFEENGILVEDCAPKLYKHMFEKGKVPRIGKNFLPEIQKELECLLKLASDAKPSSSIDTILDEQRNYNIKWITPEKTCCRC